MTPPFTYRRRWGIHFCPFDADCRKWRTPARLTITTPRFGLGIALSRAARYWSRGKWRRWTWWR